MVTYDESVLGRIDIYQSSRISELYLFFDIRIAVCGIISK